MNRAVVQLFQSKGLSTLINDNLLDNILSFGHCVVGVLSMFIAYIYSYFIGFPPQNIESVLLTSSGFFIGYFMCMLTLNVVSSATSTVYVCFVENPSLLQVLYLSFLLKILFYMFFLNVLLSRLIILNIMSIYYQDGESFILTV